jgi:pimeloyl-ACP methyl ester carboxylesterase
LQRLIIDPAEAEATIFFIHDTLTHLHQWDAQLKHFRRKRSFRVIAYDALGCGGSSKPEAKDAYSEDELLEDFLELWRQHFMEGKVNVIVGHGYGDVMAVR